MFFYLGWGDNLTFFTRPLTMELNLVSWTVVMKLWECTVVQCPASIKAKSMLKKNKNKTKIQEILKMPDK